MVLESLTDPLRAERMPKKMFYYGLLYTSIAIILSIWVYNKYASLVMVFLTTLACVPLIYNTMKLEEQKDESIMQESVLLKEHTRALKFFMFLFIGMVVAFTVWYVVLPNSMISDLYSVQIETIEEINGPSGNVVNYDSEISTFFFILFNNTKVLVFALLFAFLYGVGAIFILTWNASVIGTAMGIFIKLELAKAAQYTGFPVIAHYFKSSFVGLFKYSLHGIPEILAYFVGGLAAGIISVAVMKKRLEWEKFRHILLDASDLLILAFVLLVVAALVEVFITPYVF